MTNPSPIIKMRPYHYQRPPPSPPMESENWIKPVKSPFRRTTMKRRCGSPSFFPKKVHVTEEKVAEEFGNLTLCNTSTQYHSSGAEVQKPHFLLDGKTRRKTFQELEDSIEIDSLAEAIDPIPTVELAPELASEIRKISRKILTAGSYRFGTKRLPCNPCQELVLWQPPAGSLGHILAAIRDSNGSGDSDDDGQRYTATRLDRIEEEDASQLQAISQMDEMDTSYNVLPSNQYPSCHIGLLSTDKTETDREKRMFENSNMDFCMDI